MVTTSRQIFSHPAPFVATEGPRELQEEEMTQIDRWVKILLPNHNPRERREAYPGGEGVIAGGGTAREVFKEDHGDPGGRMRDGESEEASEEVAIAWEGRKEEIGEM